MLLLLLLGVEYNADVLFCCEVIENLHSGGHGIGKSANIILNGINRNNAIPRDIIPNIINLFFITNVVYIIGKYIGISK